MRNIYENTVEELEQRYRELHESEKRPPNSWVVTDKDGNEISFSDILGSDADEIVDSINLKIQAGKLYKAINSVLTPRERLVIISRYGLDGREPLPQREIAASLGISRSYISRIEKRALEKLRAELGGSDTCAKL